MFFELFLSPKIFSKTPKFISSFVFYYYICIVE